MKTQLHPSNFKFQRAVTRFLGSGLLSTCLILSGVGCKKQMAGHDNLDPAGVYALVSVDGKSLPCSLSHEGESPTVKSGTFTITADSNCISRITFSLPDRGDMSREVKATYTRQGMELTMLWEGAGMTMGHIEGSAFTMTNEGIVFAYRK